MSQDRSQTSTASRKPVILMVDDDPNNLAVIRDCLIDCNYTLLVAEEGESAIQRAAYARPDLILLDVMMPGIDGYETCRQLKEREETKDIPVIFMTALAETSHKVRGLEAGAVDYITKPFQREETMARVAVHLKIRELTHRLQETNETLEQKVEERTTDLSNANRELEEEIAERQAAQEQLQEQAQLLEEKVEALEQAQQELLVREQQLRQSQKMEAIGTLAAGIAHDFNNILTSIVGHTELALNKLQNDSPLTKHLHQVFQSSMRATELVKQILTFSRQSEHEMKPVQLGAVTKEVTKLLRSTLPTTVEIRLHIEGGEERYGILADSIQMHQVIMNLGTNAAHAMREHGGSLDLSLSVVELDECFAQNHPGITPGRHVMLAVTDTGHGMDAVTLEKIFDPYFTTKKSGEGTGLGLAVVLGIVINHKGAITVESRPQAGTTFKIYLPLVEACLVASPAEGVHVPKSTARILFVDDEETLASLGKEMLEDLGYQVTAITDSNQALQLFASAPSSFDLVVTDLTMPIMTGVELARQLKSIRPSTPIILCTGYNDVKKHDDESHSSFCAYVNKPYNVRTLANTVHDALICAVMSSASR